MSLPQTFVGPGSAASGPTNPLLWDSGPTDWLLWDSGSNDYLLWV